MKNIKIIFDNSSDIVCSGQYLKGNVQIVPDSTKKIKAISIVIKGESTVNWLKKEPHIDSNGSESNKEVSFYSHEEYINDKIYLLGSPSSSSVEVEPGEHNYVFNIAIPQRAPSSFEGEKGFIRYTVKVTIERPWKFDKVLKKPFTVISPLDLNYCPGVRNPIMVCASRKFYGCFFKSGEMVAKVSIPSTGFVNGQAVLFTIEIENTSRTSIRNVKYVLYQSVTYHSTWPRKIWTQNREIVTQFKSGRSFASRTNTSFTERFMIPFVPPSYLVNCGIIDLHYEIHVIFKLKRNKNHLVAILPIQIGSIALMNLESSTLSDPNCSLGLNSTQGQHSSTMSAIGWDPNISDTSTTCLLPPPSYDEIIKNKQSMRELPPTYPGFNVADIPTAPDDEGAAGPSAPRTSP